MLNKLTGVSLMLVVVASICLLASVQVSEAFGIISSKRYRANGPAPVIRRSFKLNRRVPLPETATSSDSPTSATDSPTTTSEDTSTSSDATDSPTSTSQDKPTETTSSDSTTNTSTDSPTTKSKDTSTETTSSDATDSPTTTSKDTSTETTSSDATDSPTSTSKDKSTETTSSGTDTTDNPTSTSDNKSTTSTSASSATNDASDSPTSTSSDNTDSPTTTSKSKNTESTSTDTTDSPTSTSDIPLPLVGSLTSPLTSITPSPTDPSPDKSTDKPTDTPTDSPTGTPTDSPTKTPTDSPTTTPTDSPTSSPSLPSTDDNTPTPVPTASNTDSPAQTSSPETSAETTPVGTSTNNTSQITPTTMARESPTELPSDNNSITDGTPSSYITDAPSTSILNVPTSDIQLPSPQPGVEVTPTTTDSNLPDIIIPPGNVQPPVDSVTIQLKFTTITWSDLLNNGILASQIAVVLPQDIGNAVDIPASDVIVLSENNDNGAIVLKLSIPQNNFDDVKSAISNPSSNLYTNGSKLTQYLDTTFPITPIADSVASVTDPNNDGNPNADISNGSDTPSSNAINDSANGHRALVVVLAVGLSTFLYAGLTALVIRAYKRNKARAGHRQTDYTYGPAIASPMMRGTVLT